MGCDIHAFVEVKHSGKWLTYSEADIDRDYVLFSKMANVRNYGADVVPISEPRGLPDDASEVVKIESDRWNSDGHSHSFLSKEEIQIILNWALSVNVDFRWQLRSQFGYILTDIEDYPQYEDVRLVFWFDN